jgi:hypothetical protein
MELYSISTSYYCMILEKWYKHQIQNADRPIELQCLHLRVAVDRGWCGNRWSHSFPTNECLETNVLEIREDDVIALACTPERREQE